MRMKWSTIVILITLSRLVTAGNDPTPGAGYMDLPLASTGAPYTLASLLERLYRPRGVHYTLAPELAGDTVVPTRGTPTLEEDQVLAGYSHVIERDQNGRMINLVITGRHGDGTRSDPQAFSSAGSDQLARDSQQFSDRLPLNAVFPWEVAPETLLSLPLGAKLAVRLPIGEVNIVHDNLMAHANGDKTWIGYLDGEGSDYRTIITMGQEGISGQILTPQGLFLIEANGGRIGLIDVTAANLNASTMLGDDLVGDARAFHGRSKILQHRRYEAATASTVSNVSVQPVVTTPSTPKIVVDLLVFYTPNFARGAPSTRLNQIVAMANQAYIDSKINLSVRLVYAQKMAYSETVGNSQALTDLTNGRGVFSGTQALRKQYGADLVTLLRPFSYANHGNCGTGWVNGANGSALSRNLAYSAVGDGVDYSTKYYCTDLTLAHELGHNMGSVHDKAHSNMAGKYPYSYGHGKNGVFGTVMSYYNPQLGMFSNPATLCKGQACGIANQADNARSLNQTAATIANFSPSIVP